MLLAIRLGCSRYRSGNVEVKAKVKVCVRG